MEITDKNGEHGGTGYAPMLLEYVERYPDFFFRPLRLAKKVGLSAKKVSKILLLLHKKELLKRIDLGRSLKRPYYRIRL